MQFENQPDLGEHTCTYTPTSIFWPSGLCPGLPRWAGTRTNLDFTEARDSEWQWHQMGHVQICTSPQTDNHASPHQSVFYRPDALPATQPRASKHWREENCFMERGPFLSLSTPSSLRYLSRWDVFCILEFLFFITTVCHFGTLVTVTSWQINYIQCSPIKKQSPRKKILHFSSGCMNFSETFRLCMWVFTTFTTYPANSIETIDMI